jgi:hypothetical protein
MPKQLKQLLVIPFHMSDSNLSLNPRERVIELESIIRHVTYALELSGILQDALRCSMNIPLIAPSLACDFSKRNLDYSIKEIDGCTSHNLVTRCAFKNYAADSEEWMKQDSSKETKSIDSLIEEIDWYLRLDDPLVMILVPASDASLFRNRLGRKYPSKQKYPMANVMSGVGWSECFSVIIDGSIPRIHWSEEEWYSEIVRINKHVNWTESITNRTNEMARRLLCLKIYEIGVHDKFMTPILENFAKYYVV